MESLEDESTLREARAQRAMEAGSQTGPDPKGPRVRQSLCS